MEGNKLITGLLIGGFSAAIITIIAYEMIMQNVADGIQHIKKLNPSGSNIPYRYPVHKYVYPKFSTSY